MVQFSLNLPKTQTFSIATDLLKKLPIAPNKFCSSTTKDYYADIYNNKKSEF